MTARARGSAFAEWVAGITGELQAAGFEVGSYAGFPLVTKPADMEGTIRLLEWGSPSGLPCFKSVYAEGLIVTPERINRGR